MASLVRFSCVPGQPSAPSPSLSWAGSVTSPFQRSFGCLKLTGFIFCLFSLAALSSFLLLMVLISDAAGFSKVCESCSWVFPLLRCYNFLCASVKKINTVKFYFPVFRLGTLWDLKHNSFSFKSISIHLFYDSCIQNNPEKLAEGSTRGSAGGKANGYFRTLILHGKLSNWSSIRPSFFFFFFNLNGNRFELRFLVVMFMFVSKPLLEKEEKRKRKPCICGIFLILLCLKSERKIVWVYWWTSSTKVSVFTLYIASARITGKFTGIAGKFILNDVPVFDNTMAFSSKSVCLFHVGYFFWRTLNICKIIFVKTFGAISIVILLFVVKIILRPSPKQG